jgi:hypothetical protein
LYAAGDRIDGQFLIEGLCSDAGGMCPVVH